MWDCEADPASQSSLPGELVGTEYAAWLEVHGLSNFFVSRGVSYLSKLCVGGEAKSTPHQGKRQGGHRRGGKQIPPRGQRREIVHRGLIKLAPHFGSPYLQKGHSSDSSAKRRLTFHASYPCSDVLRQPWPLRLSWPFKINRSLPASNCCVYDWRETAALYLLRAFPPVCRRGIGVSRGLRGQWDGKARRRLLLCWMCWHHFARCVFIYFC